MYLGRLDMAPGHECRRCGGWSDANVLTNALHDWRCWGVGTMLANLRFRMAR